jgi:lipase maturation factor 1
MVALRWLFAPRTEGFGHLWPRWLFLRALGLVFFSAFYSLAYQIHGLIGPSGVLPADGYLKRVATVFPGLSRFWYAPTFLWLGSGKGALTALVVIGGVASVLLILNLWPRVSILVGLLAFLSFIGAAQDFASYQSDGMLLEASFISLFFAQSGVRPGLGARSPPSRASTFLLLGEWFRIYFESGVVKLASGDPAWRDMTAMDHYYENGPLPTWLGWYVQHWGHWFHATTSLLTLVIELGLVFLAFLPRQYRLACFLIVTPLQIGIIATANYAFLNYIVLSLGVLLLDDEWIERAKRFALRQREPAEVSLSETPALPATPVWRLVTSAVPLTWVFYATCADFLLTGAPPELQWLLSPVHALEPIRIANRYGLFAVMTPARYEIEFQGTSDGVTWKPYPFRYKPQALDAPPGIYAPYQPRFEWNLWFASLGGCRDNRWVWNAQARLLDSDAGVLELFASNPFAASRPIAVRSIASQYWFTDLETKRATGRWWRRDDIGPYCAMVTRAGERAR